MKFTITLLAALLMGQAMGSDLKNLLLNGAFDFHSFILQALTLRYQIPFIDFGLIGDLVNT